MGPNETYRVNVVRFKGGFPPSVLCSLPIPPPPPPFFSFLRATPRFVEPSLCYAPLRCQGLTLAPPPFLLAPEYMDPPSKRGRCVRVVPPLIVDEEGNDVVEFHHMGAVDGNDSVVVMLALFPASVRVVTGFTPGSYDWDTQERIVSHVYPLNTPDGAPLFLSDGADIALTTPGPRPRPPGALFSDNIRHRIGVFNLDTLAPHAGGGNLPEGLVRPGLLTTAQDVAAVVCTAPGELKIVLFTDSGDATWDWTPIRAIPMPAEALPTSRWGLTSMPMLEAIALSRDGTKLVVADVAFKRVRAFNTGDGSPAPDLFATDKWITGVRQTPTGWAFLLEETGCHGFMIYVDDAGTGTPCDPSNVDPFFSFTEEMMTDPVSNCPKFFLRHDGSVVVHYNSHPANFFTVLSMRAEKDRGYVPVFDRARAADADADAAAAASASDVE